MMADSKKAVFSSSRRLKRMRCQTPYILYIWAAAPILVHVWDFYDILRVLTVCAHTKTATELKSSLISYATAHRVAYSCCWRNVFLKPGRQTSKPWKIVWHFWRRHFNLNHDDKTCFGTFNMVAFKSLFFLFYKIYSVLTAQRSGTRASVKAEC